MKQIELADRLGAVGGVLALLAAAAGLAVPDLYRDPRFWADQARGTDVATLLLAVPVLMAGLVTARRGSILGRLAVVGALLYLVYNYAIFSFAVAMNALTIAYILTFGLAVWSIVLALPALDVDTAAANTRTRLPRRSAASVLIGVGLLFGAMWLGQIGAATASGELPAELVRSGLPTNPVYALDLAVFLPLSILTGIALWRRHPAVLVALAVPMVIWLSLTTAGIVAAFAFQAASGDVVPIPVAIVVAGIGFVTAVLPSVAVARGPAQAPNDTRRGPRPTRERTGIRGRINARET